MGKNTVKYPDWVEKYRGRGRTIRKVRNGYGLYKCTSKNVPGLPYPKSVQTYLGMITEKDGFIPKRSDAGRRYLEYGLSHMIWQNFRRDIMRSMYGAHENETMLAVIAFVFGSIDEVFIRSSYLTCSKADELAETAGRLNDTRKIFRAAEKLEGILRKRIPDDTEYNTVTRLLFLCVVKEGPESKIRPDIPEEVKDILDRHELRHD